MPAQGGDDGDNVAERRSLSLSELALERMSHFRGARTLWMGASLLVAAVLILALPGSLSLSGRVILTSFACALLLWSFSDIKDVYVAVVAATVSFVASGFRMSLVFDVVTNAATITIVSAFVLAAAARKSGVVDLLASRLFSRPATVGSTLNRLAVINFATVAVIPATSARAAIALPMSEHIDAQMPLKSQRTGVSLVVPVTILMSAAASLLGAGAHVISVEILQTGTGRRINFLEWLWYCLPYAIISTLVSVVTIKVMFVPRADRAQIVRLAVESDAAKTLTPAARRILGVLAAVVSGWILSSIVGFSAAIPAVAGVVLVVLPRLGVITPREAIVKIPWDLVTFLIATLVLAETLIESGASQYLLSGVIGWLHTSRHEAWLTALVVIVVSLLAHLIVHSRSARSSVLIPLIIPLAIATSVNPTALMLASTLAAGFCLTLPVCAKPLLMFSRGGDMGREQLLRLSGVLLPFHGVLLLFFVLVAWPLMGLPLSI